MRGYIFDPFDTDLLAWPKRWAEPSTHQFLINQLFKKEERGQKLGLPDPSKNAEAGLNILRGNGNGCFYSKCKTLYSTLPLQYSSLVGGRGAGDLGQQHRLPPQHHRVRSGPRQRLEAGVDILLKLSLKVINLHFPREYRDLNFLQPMKYF